MPSAPQPQPTDSVPLVSLSQIETLLPGIDGDDALQLVEKYLEAHPDDPMALLLKAELCLDSNQSWDFVGRFVTDSAEVMTGNPRFINLNLRVRKLIRDKLVQGRRQFKNRYGDTPISAFDAACLLAPSDPSVALAAALALIEHQQNDKQDEVWDDDDSVLDVLNHLAAANERSGRYDAEIEKYLRWTLERGQPGTLPHEEAARQLARHLVQQSKFEQALALLDTVPDTLPGRQNIVSEIEVRVVQVVLGAVMVLLRAGQVAQATSLLDACLKAAPDMAGAYLLRGEIEQVNAHPQKALTAYRKALRLADKHRYTTVEGGARMAWDRAQRFQITCPRCGKASAAFALTCDLCEAPLAKRELLLDRYRLQKAPETVIAHVGLAHLLAAEKQTARARYHADLALKLLGNKAEQPIRELRGSLETQVTESSAIWELSGAAEQPLSLDTVKRIQQLSVANPGGWLEVPLKSRLALARGLVKAEYIEAARQFMTVAFTDNPARKSVTDLHARLDKAVSARIGLLLTETRQTLEARQIERALDLTEQALALNPGDLEARLLHGECLLRSGRGPAALNDFRAVIAAASNPSLVELARISAARTLEARRDAAGALTFLEGLQGEAAGIIRARLERQRRWEPYIEVRAVQDTVMHDTLTRVENEPHYQGFFAVAVRMVGRTHDDAGMQYILNAGFEFVQALEGLRNVIGDPVFALRLICHPHTQLSDRGTITAAFLGRVSAQGEDECRTLALNLWRTLRDILPAVQAYTYFFEPVVDENELTALLAPFKVTNVAQIVRRESVPQGNGDRYAVYSFTPGSLDLQNLCWALLRQPAPALLSVHLLPTALMPWEQAALDQMMTDQANGDRLTRYDNVQSADPISQWWQGAPQWSQAHANRNLVDALVTQANVVQVNIAGSAGSSSLLPELVASTMFGSVRLGGGVTHGGYEIIRASSAEEMHIAQRNLLNLDVENWVYTAAPRH
ncbi:MAG: tetratricopeptide repeat protein, partial [Anaerolineae bacterium]|nr:tetratricopeptide repeat protein [Anaerolineae bacterium]